MIKNGKNWVMKRWAFLSLVCLYSVLGFAQSTVVRRPTAKTKPKADTPVKAKSKRNVSCGNNRNGGNRSNNQMSESEKLQVINNLVNNMVYVSGGSFYMGATSEQGSEADDDEKPSHQVTLSNFYIGKYEVTQKEWRAVMGSNPSYYKGDNRPIESVNWEDCQTFIRKLNALTGRSFRLPTEAEWEFAARGGNNGRGYKYAGSNDIDSVAWYNDGNGTYNVGTKQANELGLYDMSGNVWERCQDWYGSYSSSSQTNPRGASLGFRRVVRGGSWIYGAVYCRVSDRYYYTPSARREFLGLRLAL